MNARAEDQLNSVTENDEENLIGHRIRQTRTQLGISAAELGNRVGVSRSMISQIELGRTNASVPVLKAIAAALGVPLFTLFMDDSHGGEIVRKDARRKIHLPGSDIVREMLVPDTHRKMYLVTSTMPPHSRSSIQPSIHQGEECLVVLRGTITVFYHTDEIVLHGGDSFYFDGSVPHVCENFSDEEAEILVAITN